MTVIKERPLNPLQRAYLMGRDPQVPLGGVAMHDFRQFYCDLSASEFETSVQQLVQKHAVLRTIIDKDTLVQKVLDDIVLNIEIIDLTEQQSQHAQQAIERLREQYSHRILPLNQPLWHMCLILRPKNADNTGKSAVLLTSFDGLIVDGYAIAVLLDELLNTKTLFQPNHARQLPPSYFANTPADQAYWQDKLADIETTITLPWQRDLETLVSPHYKRKGIVIPQAIWQEISALGAKHQLLPNSVLTTALFEVIALWANEHDLFVSMPISNSMLYPALGNHSSFIVVTYHVSEAQNFVEKAKSLQKEVLEALSHTTFSGVELGKILLKKTGKLVSLPVAVTNGLSWGTGAFDHAEYVSGVTQTPQLALDIRIRQTANQDIAIDFDYAEPALPAIVITQMLQTLKQHLIALSQATILQQVTPPSLLAQTVQSPCVQQEITSDPIASIDNYLLRIKEHLYGQQHERIALIYDDKPISYQTLGKLVAKIAHQLSVSNINKHDVVAICLPKSPEHVAVKLACSLVNVIWLPIDMDSPPERIEYMLRNAQANLIISDRPLAYGINNGINTIDIHQIRDNPELSETLDCQPILDDKPGYYLYTSGSTGTPKCVVLNHLATANVIEQTNQTWHLTHEDVLFAATPFHHDMSVYELFGAMSLGASLVLPTSDQTKSAMDWARMIEQYQISIWSSVPAIVDMLLTCVKPEQMCSIKLIAQGGDYVKPSVIAKLREYLPDARLFSLGGPTETTIWSIWHEITHEDTEIIPYGNALKHNRYYILNEKEQHCPHFVIGTICMSGVNVANGYLKDGEMNQNDFGVITTPEGQPVRVYKTSDRGYFREDGKIIFSGRKAGYLKVRGVRIASAEIEMSLNKHPAIRDTIALACVNPHYQVSELVVVYLTENNQDVNHRDLRQFLKGKLPDSHIPSRWLQLESFPLTRNGKIDRKQLQIATEQQIYPTNTESIGKHPQRHAVSGANMAKPNRLEDMVLNVFAETLAQQTGTLSRQTEILSLGLRPKQLNQIAKRLSQDIQRDVDLYTLAKATTLGDVVASLSK
jgi:nonribosomal peptide synthetase VibF